MIGSNNENTIYEELPDSYKKAKKVVATPKKSVAAKIKPEKEDGYTGTNEIEPNESHSLRNVKTLGNSDQNACRKNVKDVVMFGDDLFKLLSKASSEVEGWMKSTKAMDTGAGCVVQVTTQQCNPDGSYSVAEALTFVPNVKIREQFAGGAGGTATARSLVARH